MARLYIDVTAVVAIWMGGLLLLVALLGIVIRQSGVPFLAALAEYRRIGGRSPQARAIVERIAQLEKRIAQLERNPAPSHRIPASSSRNAPPLNSTAGAS